MDNGDAEGVDPTVVDEFDNEFGNGTDLMNIDLPDDSALFQREVALLEDLNKALDKIEINTCDDCLEEGFDLSVEDGRCSRCRNDTGDPVRKWLAANKVHPGKPSMRPLSVTQ